MAFNSGKGIPTTWKKTSVSKYAKWDFGNLKRKENMIKKIFDFWLPKSNYLNFEVAWFMISLKFLVSHKMAPLCLNAEFWSTVKSRRFFQLNENYRLAQNWQIYFYKLFCLIMTTVRSIYDIIKISWFNQHYVLDYFNNLFR